VTFVHVRDLHYSLKGRSTFAQADRICWIIRPHLGHAECLEAAHAIPALAGVFAARAEGARPLRPASDACSAYAGWLSGSWLLLNAQAHSPGFITAGKERLVRWTRLK
jgi:hypothetical protein